MSTATAVEEEPQAVIEFGLWWPAADPGELLAMAEVWDLLADDVERASRSLTDVAAGVSSSNRGDAVEAFDDLVETWTDAHLPEAAQHARDLAEGLRSYAEAVDETRSELVRMAAEIAASIAVGVGLAFFTAGVSAGVAATVTASMVARAGVLATSLAGRALAIGARLVVYGGVGGIEAGATNLVIQTGRNVYLNDNRNPLDGYDLTELGVATTGGVVLGGATAGFRSLTVLRRTLPPTHTSASIREILRAIPRGASKSGKVRVVEADEALGRLFDELSSGGKIVLESPERLMVELADGTTLSMRQFSASGGRTIDIALTPKGWLKVHVR